LAEGSEDWVRAIASKLDPAWISASSDSARSAELTTIKRKLICGSAGVCAWIATNAAMTAAITAVNARPMRRN
jgi:hypothetical protein